MSVALLHCEQLLGVWPLGCPLTVVWSTVLGQANRQMRAIKYPFSILSLFLTAGKVFDLTLMDVVYRGDKPVLKT
ncbi:uncharacterized protein METZ01_LOCUS125535 [marine metagenome]|uniref:Uncharacterized protein n=1 Tax=marine metagenome TaxID=408172 RepID=A0A381Y7U3_9ZZZZ